MSIYCALPTPQWKQGLRSSSMHVEEIWSLKCNIARLNRQNRKFPPILIIIEVKNACFFVCKWTGFIHQEFCKNDSDSSFESLIVSRAILWKTWLESSLNLKNLNHFTSIQGCSAFSQRDSSRIRVTKNRESSHAVTGYMHSEYITYLKKFNVLMFKQSNRLT